MGTASGLASSEGHLDGSHSLLKDTPCSSLLLPWPKPWPSDGASKAPKLSVTLLGLCVTPPPPAMAHPKLVQDRRAGPQHGWQGRGPFTPRCLSQALSCPAAPAIPLEGTMLPSQGPSVELPGFVGGTSSGGRGGALCAVCNTVIPLRPRQNRHLRESPQHHPARPTRSPKGSLDHTRVAELMSRHARLPGKRAESGQRAGRAGELRDPPVRARGLSRWWPGPNTVSLSPQSSSLKAWAAPLGCRAQG